MMPPSLNRALAARHDCIGRAHESQRGPHFNITIDAASAKRCVATIDPYDEVSAYSGMTESGLLFVAMEHLATHVPVILKGDASNVWVLRNASITHFRSGCLDQPITLSAFIEWDGIPGEPIVVHTEACDGADGLLAEADYTIVPVPARRFHRGSSIPLATGSFEVPRAMELDGRAD